jgi:tetratricopeptide (TPR) repeat protein
MEKIDPGETRPSRPEGKVEPEGDSFGQNATQPVRPYSPVSRIGSFVRKDFRRLIWVFFTVLMLVLGSVTGALAAYRSAANTLQDRQGFQSILVLTDQFNRGLADMETGQFEIARKRFEFILSEDPNFPGAVEKLAEVRQILYATTTPTPTGTPTPTPTDTPTVTPTPTRDPRPLEEQLSVALASINEGDWNRAIETLLAMRSSDPSFQTVRVDGLLFLSLRSRGLDRILNRRDLEGGAYDLSLAENFGPLDSRATWARQMVRLYMYGSAFWEAYPEQAVFYFGQVAAAAPYLTDASGWTSSARYRASLVHYGDYLARQDDWCSAQAYYELALSYGFDGELAEKVEKAAYECSPPTATPTQEPTGTVTPEIVLTETPDAPATEQPAPTETSIPPSEEPTAQPDPPTPTEENPLSETPQTAEPSPTVTTQEQSPMETGTPVP